jgi:hypothetical protein
LDYVADLGDGFNPTYAIAWLLSREELDLLDADGKVVETTPRGRILVMGGDQVYPIATREQYQNRLVGPYRAALPCVHNRKPPDLFAIPGNHDWYDGLTSFTRLFCQSRSIGVYQTSQRRSYFSIRLPGDWWLWGIDIQLESDIDDSQLDYFRDIADEIVAEVGAGEAKIILVTAEPSWVYSAGPSPSGSGRDQSEVAQKEEPSSGAPGVSAARQRRPKGGRLQTEPEAYKSLSYFEERVIRAKKSAFKTTKAFCGSASRGMGSPFTRSAAGKSRVAGSSIRKVPVKRGSALRAVRSIRRSRPTPHDRPPD